MDPLTTQERSIAALDGLEHLQNIASTVLRVRESALDGYIDRGYLTAPLTVQGVASDLGTTTRQWLRIKACELELECTSVLEAMYADVLACIVAQGASPTALATISLTLTSSSMEIAARLIELRELLQQVGPLHRAFLGLGAPE